MLCAAFLFPFLCVEAYFRITYPSSTPVGGHEPNRELGWERVEPVQELQNTGAPLKVFFLGDSNVDGKLWMQFTQDEAAVRGLAFDGYSLGVSGHGTTQQLLKLEKYYDAYRPDVVVLLFTSWNDLRDNVRTPGVYYSPTLISRPYYERSGSGWTLWNEPPSLLARFLSRSEVYVRIVQRMGLIVNRRIAREHMAFIVDHRIPLRMLYDEHAAWEPFYDAEQQENPYVTLAYDTTAENLRRMKEFLDARGVTLIALGMDNAFTVDPDTFEIAVRAPEHFDGALPLTRSAAMFQALDIPFVSALPGLRAAQQRTGEKIYDGQIGGHLIPEGERVLAELATELLMRNVSGR